MTSQNLITLLEDLRARNVSRLVGAEILGTGLRLTLDLKKGFEGFEELIATPQNPGFLVDYSGLYPAAVKTFQNPQYKHYVDNSGLLKRFKEQIGKQVSSMNQMLDLEEQESELEKIRNAFLNMQIIFTKKAKSYAPNA